MNLYERFRTTLKAYAGDETLMQAAVSACANVAVADGELMTEEFETALAGWTGEKARLRMEQHHDLTKTLAAEIAFTYQVKYEATHES